MSRLPESPTNIIDRSKKLSFTLAGKSMTAFAGDMVATALYAAGIRVMADSFKYHRPRGLYELGLYAADPMMKVNGRYNTRIARQAVAEGMAVEPQFKTGLDVYKLADKASGAMQVGFYYKNPALYKSRTAWEKARKMMRTAPGNLGRIKPLKEKPAVEEVNLTPELLVVGGGLAGLEAALAGAKTGLRVVLVEAEPYLGGFQAFQGPQYREPLDELKDKTTSQGNLTVLLSTTATMLYPDGLVVCCQSGPAAEPFLERSYLIRPRAMVFATGAMDRPLMFQHNDRPGVMLPQTAQRLIHLYAVKPGQRAVLAGGDNQIYRAALDLAEAGVEVAGLADCRAEKDIPVELLAALGEKNIPAWSGQTIHEAKGKAGVTGAVVGPLEGGQGRSLKADLIVASSGITPLFKLTAQGRAAMVYDHGLGYHLPQDLPPGSAAAGRLMGLADPEAIRAQGRWAAASALEGAGLGSAKAARADRDRAREAARMVNPPQTRAVAAKDRRFICLGNDVTEKDIDRALEEGFDHLEMIKRYTTATMGPEQGGLSQANFLDYLAYKLPESMGDRKINTPRPPLAGVSMALLAGTHHDVPRTTPLHRVQLADGGQTVRSGPWLRIDHFGDPEGESLALHNSAVLLDVSTLGKFRLFGPDAAEWFNRINTRPIDRLKDGKVLYFAAVNEEGVVVDDGIAVKLAEEDYYFTSSTARSALVQPWYRNFKDSRWWAWLVTLTEAYAGMNLCGPRAGDILSALSGADLSLRALPFMGWLRAEVAGVEALIFRLGFLGEASFELHCPSGQAEHLWQEILWAGREHGIKPAGLETQFICRLEKGHILPGLDIDGNTTIFEAGFDWLWDKNKTDTVGGPMLKLLKSEPHKCRSVGFAAPGRAGLIDGDLVVRDGERLGFVTSTRYSPVLDQTIGLALVNLDGGLTGGGSDVDHTDYFKPGGRISLYHDGRIIDVDCLKPPFFDPAGERMKS